MAIQSRVAALTILLAATGAAADTMVYGGTGQYYATGYSLNAPATEVNDFGHSGTTSLNLDITPAAWSQLRLLYSGSGLDVGGQDILSFWIYFATDASHDVHEFDRVDIRVWDSTGTLVNSNQEYKTNNSTIYVNGIQDTSGDIEVPADQWAFVEIELDSKGFIVTKVGLFDFKTDDAGTGFNFYVDDVILTPEPASMGLLALGGALTMVRRHRD